MMPTYLPQYIQSPTSAEKVDDTWEATLSLRIEFKISILQAPQLIDFFQTAFYFAPFPVLFIHLLTIFLF